MEGMFLWSNFSSIEESRKAIASVLAVGRMGVTSHKDRWNSHLGWNFIDYHQYETLVTIGVGNDTGWCTRDHGLLRLKSGLEPQINLLMIWP
ncbi:hypothetical protein PHLCEN_2v7021 [Hermanssonia centrifuga]|uniref:Uncharacterized protein n=1 Tax=Hermanssonia centrifuga TaxID=98765 RepID=A0A2R6NXU4_9APHY|nr:hypothetical protein PHLCEN_2v7021 [Hermanssonia centrifuga]